MNQVSRMNDFDATTHSSTSTGSLFSAERPLRNVNIDPSYASVIEEQDQKLNTCNNNRLSLIAYDIEHCQATQAGVRMLS